MVKALMRTLAPSSPLARASSHAAGAPEAAGAQAAEPARSCAPSASSHAQACPSAAADARLRTTAAKIASRRRGRRIRRPARRPPRGALQSRWTERKCHQIRWTAAPAPPHDPGPQGLNQALERVLEESATGSADWLESLFETSVLMFPRGDYRGAITQVP